MYDVTKDPYEWTNLADDPDYAEVQADLRRRLEAWMKEQGDLGQATEAAAKERQGRNRKKKPKKPRPCFRKPMIVTPTKTTPAMMKVTTMWLVKVKL